MAYCGHCGARLAEGDEFCRACGTAISDVMPLSGPWAENSARRTGRIALTALGAVVAVLVVAAIAYFGVIQPMRNTEPHMPIVGTATTPTSSALSSSPTTGGASSAVTPTTPAPAVQHPATPTKPKSTPTANDVTHQATHITKSGVADGGADTLTMDYVQFLTGDAATKAAAAHGDTVENDYYVVNDNKKLRTFPVSTGVVIKLQPANGPQYSRFFTLSQFKALMSSHTASYGGMMYDWSSLTVYFVNVNKGKIVRIEQQWVP